MKNIAKYKCIRKQACSNLGDVWKTVELQLWDGSGMRRPITVKHLADRSLIAPDHSFPRLTPICPGHHQINPLQYMSWTHWLPTHALQITLKGCWKPRQYFITICPNYCKYKHSQSLALVSPVFSKGCTEW